MSENEKDLESYIDEYGINHGNFFQRNVFVIRGTDKDRLENEEAARNEYPGKDVYRRIYSSSEMDIEPSLVYGPLYLDFDCNDIGDEEEFRKLKSDVCLIMDSLIDDWGIPEKMIELYFSGSKGFHIMIDPIVFNLEPKKTLNTEYKIIAIYMKWCTTNHFVDTKIYDKNRLFRVVNTVNSKTGLYKIPLSYEELKTINYQVLIEMAKNKRTLKKDKPKVVNKASLFYNSMMNRIKEYAAEKAINKKEHNNEINISDIEEKEILPCISAGIAEGIGKGSRNNALVALSSGLFQYGTPEEEVEEIMTEWNRANDDPLDEREVKVTIRSAYKMFESGKKYGCDTFKSLGFCSGESCRLYNKGEI